MRVLRSRMRPTICDQVGMHEGQMLVKALHLAVVVHMWTRQPTEELLMKLGPDTPMNRSSHAIVAHRPDSRTKSARSAVRQDRTVPAETLEKLYSTMLDLDHGTYPVVTSSADRRLKNGTCGRPATFGNAHVPTDHPRSRRQGRVRRHRARPFPTRRVSPARGRRRQRAAYRWPA